MIARVSASGGEVVSVLTKGVAVVRPFFLPDGRHFLFTSFRALGEAEGIYVGSLDSNETKLVIPGAYSNSVYVEPGVILYWRDGDLRAQRFDLKKLEVVGNPIKIADRVQYEPDTSCALFTASDDGTLVYATGSGAGMTELAWVDREGKELDKLAPPAMYYTPRLSHDGRRVAVDLSDPVTAKGDIWIFDNERKLSTKLTYDAANESAPAWSPDDRHIVYFSESSGMNLFRKPASGVGREELVFADGFRKAPLDWSRDGRFVLFTSVDPKLARGSDIWVLSTIDRKARPWLGTEFEENGAMFSPDGKWVTYWSNESGRPEVYVQSFDGAGGKFLVSSSGGLAPFWRTDGKEIIYFSSDRKLMAVPVRLDGATFEAGVPIPLFEARLRAASVAQHVASPDGRSLLLNRLAVEEGQEPFTFVQNWTAGVELR